MSLYQPHSSFCLKCSFDALAIAMFLKGDKLLSLIPVPLLQTTLSTKLLQNEKYIFLNVNGKGFAGC